MNRRGSRINDRSLKKWELMKKKKEKMGKRKIRKKKDV
jgi:hypothetical protein